MALALLASILLVSVASTAAAQTNLLVNGDFSQGPADTVQRGQDLLPGWMVLRHSIDHCLSNCWQNPPGTIASVDLSGTGPKTGDFNQRGTIAQSFPTTPGAPYTLSFYRSGNPTIDLSSGCGAALNNVKKMRIDVANVTAHYSWDITKKQNTIGQMKWELVTIPFTAADITTTLTFHSRTLGFCGPVIGGVSVVAANAASQSHREPGSLVDGLR